MKQQGIAGKIAAVNLVLVSMLCAAGLVLLYINQRTMVSGDPIGQIGGSLFALGSATIGLLILRKHPQHLVGWLFCYLALPFAIFSFSSEYAIYGLVLSLQPLPGAYLMGWLQNWVIYLAMPAAIALPYLFFPDGRLLSPRWRLVVWLAVLATTLGVINTLFYPGQVVVWRSVAYVSLPMTNFTGIVNQNRIIESIGGASWAGGILVLLAAMTSLILRYRISTGPQRQQLKWFAYLTIIVILGFIISNFLIHGRLGEIVDGIWFAVLLLSIPAAVGIAILRYKLYDIDLIIKRTVLYALLTGSLTAVYFLSVIALQRIIPIQSQLSIVLSTLLIAFLFNPLKTRLQRFIDRRFFRQKYDPEQVLKEFGGAIRDEVDPETLSQELVTVVQKTLQPEKVLLWVRDIDS